MSDEYSEKRVSLVSLIQITQFLANIGAVISIFFVLYQIKQNKDLVDKQIEVERERTVYERSLRVAETIDEDMFNVTTSWTDKSQSRMENLLSMKKALRSIIFLGVHLENGSINKDTVYALIARHGVEHYEGFIYENIESMAPKKCTTEENSMIQSILNEMTFNAGYLKIVREWGNNERKRLVDKMIDQKVIEIQPAPEGDK